MPDMPMKRSTELEAVSRRLWEAFKEGSIEALSNLISRHPDARFILGDEDEWIAGSDDLARFLSERSKTLGIHDLEIDRVEAFAIGDVGWVAGKIIFHRPSGESISFRHTATFAVEDGVWKVVQSHTSSSVPIAQTYGDETAAGLAALVESLTAGSVEEIAEVAGSSGTVTLMFTDIEDSTLLSQQRGDAAWTQDIQTHFDKVSTVVGVNKGTVIKTLGDGSMAAFPTARNAADAAIGIERAVVDDGFRIRIGIHTGEAISVGGDYAGLAVAKAARVTSAAAGGEILVSSTTRELISRFDYTFGTERVAELKGLDGSHDLYPLRWKDTP